MDEKWKIQLTEFSNSLATLTNILVIVSILLIFKLTFMLNKIKNNQII